MKYEKTSEIRHLQKHFWLDHLELYGQFFDESLFLWVDFENSNYFSFGEFVGVKHEVPSYMYKIMFSKNGYPYFAYYKGKKVWDIILNDYVCVYSTAFRIEGIDYVIWSILPYFHL